MDRRANGNDPPIVWSELLTIGRRDRKGDLISSSAEGELNWAKGEIPNSIDYASMLGNLSPEAVTLGNLTSVFSYSAPVES